MDLFYEQKLCHLKNACNDKKLHSAELILQQMVDINVSVKLNSSDYANYTPLHIIIEYYFSPYITTHLQNKCMNLIKLLLSRDAAVTIKNAKGQSSLHLIAIKYFERMSNEEDYEIPKIIDLMLSTDKNYDNCTNNEGLSHFHIACWRNNVEAAEKFLVHKKSINNCINVNFSFWSGYTLLHVAVKYNNTRIVKLLLDNGADINIKNSDGLTPLHLAAQNRNENVIELLQGQSPKHLNYVDDIGLSQFHLICMNKNRADVKKFLQKGACINGPVNSNSPIWAGYTPLHFAVLFNDHEVVELLLNHGADITIEDANKCSPIHLCKSKVKSSLISDYVLSIIFDYDTYKRENLNQDHQLLAEGVAIDSYVSRDSLAYSGYTPLHFAVEFEADETVQILLERGASIFVQDTYGLTPVHLAIKRKSKSIIDILLPYFKTEITNPVDDNNLSHFHIACMTNNTDIVQRFLEEEVEINDAITSDVTSFHFDDSNTIFHHSSGETALHIAVIHGNKEIVKLLINYGANVLTQNQNGITPLHYAARENKILIIDMLLSALNCTNLFSNSVDDTGLSLLHIACMRCNITVIKALVQQKININASVSLKNSLFMVGTPLHISVKNHCIEAIDLLIKHGANINVLDEYGRTPLHYAVTCNNLFFLLINKYGADISSKDVEGKTPLHYIFEKEINHFDISISFLKNVNFINQSGLSLFHFACISSPTLVQNYLKSKSKIKSSIYFNSPLLPGYTPLHLAVQSGCTETVKILLMHHADITTKNADGLSPLHLAVNCGNNSIIDLILLEHYKTYKNPADNEGLTHFHIACWRNKIDIIEGFLKNGADVNRQVHFFAKRWRWAGYTPLHFAVTNQDIQAIKLLLLYRANVNVFDSEGMTPLHYACSKNFIFQTDIVNHFLRFKADPNIKNLDDETPLKMAIKTGNSKLVTVLLNYKTRMNNGMLFINIME